MKYLHRLLYPTFILEYNTKIKAENLDLKDEKDRKIFSCFVAVHNMNYRGRQITKNHILQLAAAARSYFYFYFFWTCILLRNDSLSAAIKKKTEC